MDQRRIDSVVDKQPYVRPVLTDHGSVEKMTKWIGGPWGEFFGGEGNGWNPWKDPGEGNTGS